MSDFVCRRTEFIKYIVIGIAYRKNFLPTIYNIQTFDTIVSREKSISNFLLLIVKRAQDKEKLKEKDILRLQVEQLNEFKTRIMESQVSKIFKRSYSKSLSLISFRQLKLFYHIYCET